MKLITKLQKASAERKTDIWYDANLSLADETAILTAMILSLPGSYKLHSHEYGTNLRDAIYDIYGSIPSYLISEELLLGLTAIMPERVQASFTLGLDKIEIK